MIATTHLRALPHLALLAVLGCAVFARTASADPICSDCEVRMGIGGTYHFWGGTDGVVLPLTVAWSENRYEVGIFRMASPQTLHGANPSSQQLAAPYWGVSASRRWRLLERGPVRAFFGFGLAYRTESDLLSATHWDFASQLGVHVRLPGNGASVEFAVRHWSNAGVKLPNHGQDFATLTFLLDPQFFRTARLDRARDLKISRESDPYAESAVATR